MVPFANWVLSLPAGQRPKTAAYPMVDDPFADPPVEAGAGASCEARGPDGLPPPTSNSAPTPNATDSNLTPDAADKVRGHEPADRGARLGGRADRAGVHQRVQGGKRFNPKIIIAAAGPDQGQDFLNAVGTGHATGIMVPDGWYGGYPNALSHVMVQDYIAKYGGTASDINADVAEAYSAGQVLAAAVTGDGQPGQRQDHRLPAQRHTAADRAGPGHSSTSLGENTKRALAFIFQWQRSQFVQVLPSARRDSPAIGAPSRAGDRLTSRLARRTRPRHNELAG